MNRSAVKRKFKILTKMKEEGGEITPILRVDEVGQQLVTNNYDTDNDKDRNSRHSSNDTINTTDNLHSLNPEGLIMATAEFSRSRQITVPSPGFIPQEPVSPKSRNVSGAFRVACVASVSVLFRSKERPRNEILGFGRARNETRGKK